MKVDAVARTFIRPLADDRSSADDVEERRANNIDCTERANRCAFVIAAAADTRRSAVLPYTVSDL